jgi:thymidylate synthase (FAD)
MKIVKPSVELLFVTPNSAQLIEAAGRTCYKSEDLITDDSADKFVKMIGKRGHVSVIEHAYATFRFITDRGITHEIVRHRLASYSQESTRYCNYSKEKFGREISVVQPSWFATNTLEVLRARDVWADAMQTAEQRYFDLIDAGAPPQIARSVLPTCLKTEIVMTANFREWCHFIRLRLAPAAHPDIRPLAFEVWKNLVKECPPVFEMDEIRDIAYEYIDDMEGRESHAS